MPQQNKRYAILGCQIGGQRGLSLSRIATDLACCCSLTLLNPLAEKVIEKFGSMEPIVREVGLDYSNLNELGFWNGF